MKKEYIAPDVWLLQLLPQDILTSSLSVGRDHNTDGETAEDEDWELIP